MDRLRISPFAAFILGVLCSHTAAAQTAANITVVAGNGQVICETCVSPRFFQNLLVKVTDANGQPIRNKTVTWTLISTQGPQPSFQSTTTTDGNGFANNFLSQAPQAGSIAYPYLQTVIQATADSVGVLFTETQGLTDVTNHQLQFIGAAMSSPQLGANLQGTAGGTSTTPVKVHVDAFGLAVKGASVRILNGSFPE